MVEFNAEVAINDIALNATPSGDESVRSSLDIAYSMGGGLSNEEKQAILDCFAHVAWVDPEGADYYQALYDLFFPPAELVRISAVYTQSGTVYPTTSLDSLKSDLVVKAHYSDGSAVTLSSSDYTLSGTLSVGTSTVAVSYSGKNTSFTVTVSAVPTVASITAVYTQSGTVYDTDSLDSLKTDLVVTATYSDSSTETVPSTDYTLSGTLAEGTSTVTVTYAGKTDTFTVTVTSSSGPGIDDYAGTPLMILDGIANGVDGAHNDTITKWVDQSGNGRDWVTHVGTTSATEKAVVFAGSNALKDDSWQTLMTGWKTIEICVAVTYPSNTQCVLTSVDGGSSSENATGNLSVKSGGFLHYTGSTAGCASIPDSNRHTYTFVVNNGTTTTYIDGVAVSNGATTVSWKTPHKRIGCYSTNSVPSGAENKFTGSIYSIRYFSDELTAAQVAANYAVDEARFGT